MAIRYISKASPKSLRGTALVRLDFNTEDDWRLVAAIPTVRFLLRRATKIIIVSHKGRPPIIGQTGSTPSALKKFSIKPDSFKLQKLLHRPVRFISHFDFDAIKKAVDSAPSGSVLLLENLRFMKGEVENDPAFAKKLAGLADFYVNDAFAVSHRANASVAAITKFLPSFAGLELEREISSLSQVMKNPQRPLVLILGGGKAGDKLGILKYFKHRADYFLLGGVTANTMLFLKGIDVGKSFIEEDSRELKKLKSIVRYKNVFLPRDFIYSGDKIFDIGSKTTEFFSKIVGKARTIIWSGPLGFFEKKPFDKGSIAVARALLRNKKAFSLAGGGETVMFLKKFGFDKKFSFISTGGGAMLEFLEGKKLPGIEALKK